MTETNNNPTESGGRKYLGPACVTSLLVGGGLQGLDFVIEKSAGWAANIDNPILSTAVEVGNPILYGIFALYYGAQGAAGAYERWNPSQND